MTNSLDEHGEFKQTNGEKVRDEPFASPPASEVPDCNTRPKQAVCDSLISASENGEAAPVPQECQMLHLLESGVSTARALKVMPNIATWTVREMEAYAIEVNQDIDINEHSLTALYWILGNVLRELRRNYPHGTWLELLEKLKITKTRWEKAKAIRETFCDPADCKKMSVDEAYECRVRKQEQDHGSRKQTLLEFTKPGKRPPSRTKQALLPGVKRVALMPNRTRPSDASHNLNPDDANTGDDDADNVATDRPADEWEPAAEVQGSIYTQLKSLFHGVDETERSDEENDLVFLWFDINDAVRKGLKFMGEEQLRQLFEETITAIKDKSAVETAIDGLSVFEEV